jgi:hypothetical protein
LAEALRRGLGFFIAGAGFFLAFALLVAIAYFSPQEIVSEYAPKLAYAVFTFAAGMLVAMLADRNGLRRPTPSEIKLKLPIVLLAFVLCLLVLRWIEQLRAYEAQSRALAEACSVLQDGIEEDEHGPMITEVSLRAERTAIAAAQAIEALWAVRHPPVSENAPCG